MLLAVVGGPALPVAAAGAVSGSPAGMWRVDGYGTVLSVERGRLLEYQVTSVSCLKGESAGRSGGASHAPRYLTADGDAFTVRSGPRPDRASMRVDGSPNDRALRRIAALPVSCARETPAGPVAAFDVLWQTFEENYPFFAAKGIDWDAVRDRYRPRIHAGTTDAELFAVFREMLSPLHDAHVALLAGGTGVFAQSRPGTVIPGQALEDRIKAYVQERDLDGRPLREFGRGRIGYADLPGGRGYLRLSAFSGFTQANTFAANSAELDRALDAILTPARTARLKGLIIDLRINGGGSDSLGLRLAARLTDRPHFAYAKRARNDPSDPSRFTRPQPVYVQPAAGRSRFAGPVTVLTGGTTFSAGETFTQALIERPGLTVRIGEPTQGVFSDTLERRLPGGWTVLLPNEEFLTRSGHTFDGPGIPPHLSEPVFTDEEFARHLDSAFDRAVEVLRERR
ncbi:protease [Streptomyces agglomeratus]|uniref:Protease n=1 Tax=Streptomyces agglomeratus TaxID=285458 RepID=A0A1E5P309_9ACTN|nr:protease [Streptomyces agglomeratus]OEJ43316.1 protease [Streptomyces agglomeratus]OEJ54766.1 protease [Streptomyces agglomeratus]OEJ62138.1 protease [Streptomyces agglomeratus]